jgi:hypothetical protein
MAAIIYHRIIPLTLILSLGGERGIKKDDITGTRRNR